MRITERGQLVRFECNAKSDSMFQENSNTIDKLVHARQAAFSLRPRNETLDTVRQHDNYAHTRDAYT